MLLTRSVNNIIMSTLEFSKNGFVINVTKSDNESWDMFMDRGWFTVSQLSAKTTDQQYEGIESMARIWINIKYRNCKYSLAVINKLEKMTKKIDMY